MSQRVWNWLSIGAALALLWVWFARGSVHFDPFEALNVRKQQEQIVQPVAPPPPTLPPAPDRHTVAMAPAPRERTVDPLPNQQAAASMPKIVRPEASAGADTTRITISTLPNIIKPTNPHDPSGSSGSGFFVSSDGTILTVAHVVRDCKKILVGSVYLNPTPARLLVSDPVTDMAAIRIYNVKPPAILSVFDERSGRGDLDIVGYPGDIPGLVATQTNGKIRADRPPSGQGLDSRPYVWFDAPAVRPGFSGGPIIGPNGDAIGAVVGHVTTSRRSDSQVVSETKRVFGASTRMFEEFLRREAPWIVFDAGRSPSAENLKKAIVKIVCER